MKILLVSMPTLHFFRWTEQLQDSGHELNWFDILDGGEQVARLKNVGQITGWKLRYNYPGRYFIKRKLPWLYQLIQKINTKDTEAVFEKVLQEIKPDVVHSFALYVACAPILGTMLKYPKITWIYSSWGSDLFYFQNKSDYLKDIARVLPRVNYMFSDCKRDFNIAESLGFKGEFLGVYPGGGGFHFDEMNQLLTPFEKRKIILIKGFQGRSGRGINVLKAINLVLPVLKDYKIVVFGADKMVFKFAKETKLIDLENFQIYSRISHLEVLTLMGKSKIYIGNSNSDGIPNTLLEAISMGVFPIQSNPGGVSEEIISAGKNGLLIEDCEDVSEIKEKIEAAIGNLKMLEAAVASNLETIKPTLEFTAIKEEVLMKYAAVNQNIHKN
jgi:glycosyltransferase involved in cell wall biosynthesis